MKDVLVFGTNGQVSRALRSYFPQALFISRAECDFEKTVQITEVLEKYRPNLIINPAAYTEVDKAETEGERAELINARAPAIIAQWCAERNASLVHYSTDYIYQGSGQKCWSEQDPVDPQNAYGTTKLHGEEAIRQSGCHHVILRTSWVYDSSGKNFFTTMLRLGRERELLRVVNDQIGAPTYAVDLAEATKRMCDESNFSRGSGVFNLANAGSTSWYGFASLIFEILRSKGVDLKVVNVEPILSSDYPTPAKRPLNSRLDTQKFKETFGFELRAWDAAVRACLNDRKEY